jgi:hypothetical protein
MLWFSLKQTLPEEPREPVELLVTLSGGSL